MCFIAMDVVVREDLGTVSEIGLDCGLLSSDTACLAQQVLKDVQKRDDGVTPDRFNEVLADDDAREAVLIFRSSSLGGARPRHGPRSGLNQLKSSYWFSCFGRQLSLLVATLEVCAVKRA